MDDNKTKITEVVTSNDIRIPMEWSMGFPFASRYMQVTLVDDRIVIHEPLDKEMKYTAPCKAGDDSYIRTLDLLGIKVPKQLLDKLNIKDGDKIDLELEENCISIRKNIDAEPQPAESEKPEPIAGFCCVCGKLLYTESMLKVLKKYICPDCVSVVKAL